MQGKGSPIARNVSMADLAPRLARGLFRKLPWPDKARNACHHRDNERLGTTGD